MAVFKLPGITTEQRLGIVLSERELVYDTDEDVTYRGDGVTLGGVLESTRSVSSIIDAIVTTSAGDIAVSASGNVISSGV